MKIFEYIRTPDGHRKLYFLNKKILSFWVPCKFRKLYAQRFNGLTQEQIRYLLEIQFLLKVGYPLNIDNPKTLNEKITTICIGSFVWVFGIILRILLRKI